MNRLLDQLILGIIALLLLGLYNEIDAQGRSTDGSVAQQTIHLRLFGFDGEPIYYRSGAIEVIDQKVESYENVLSIGFPRNPTQPTYLLSLPDQHLKLERLPVMLRITHQGKEMQLLLNADVDSIRFRPGTYHISRPFAPLFGVRGLNETRIIETGIGCFEVLDVAQQPPFTFFENDTLQRYLLDRSQSRPYGIVHRLATARDWMERKLFMTMQWWYADPEGLIALERLYVAKDEGSAFEKRRSGVTLTSAAQEPELVRALFFATPELGWSVVDSADEGSGSLVRRTMNGGESWGVDRAMTDRKVRCAVPRDEGRAWFLGVELTEKGEKVLHLYTGPRDGTRLESVAWPTTFDPLIVSSFETHDLWREMPQLTPAGPNGLIISHPVWHGSRHLSFEGGVHRSTDIPGTLQTSHRGPDGTGWMIVQDTLHGIVLNAPFPGPFRLIRLSADGLSQRSILESDRRLHHVSFANSVIGAVVGDSFLLVTQDGGRSWRYLPGSLLKERSNGNGSHRLGELIGSTWLNEGKTLRLLYSFGYLDLPIDEFPSPQFCAEMESDFKRAEID